MKPNLQKFIALALSVSTFLTQVAMGSTAESNFWAERRKSISSQDSSQPKQLASLPSSLGHSFNSTALLNQLPSIGQNLPLAPKWSDSKSKAALDLPLKFRNVIDAIPLVYGSIQDVYDSKNELNPPVVLLQDVHLNQEAQTNIASVLQELIDQKQVALVGVEGAFTPFDFKPFRIYPNKEITKAVVDDMIRQNLLAAPSYVGITSPIEPPAFIGVDDRVHYDANLEALYASRDQKKLVVKQLELIKRSLLENKNKYFSKELRDFDNLREAHNKGTLGFGAYVKKLAATQVVIPEILSRESIDFVIEQFLEAYAMETTLDFPRVETERRTVIEKLTKNLNEKEVSTLVAQSLAYRMGRMNFGAYYSNLRDLCSQKGINLRQTPHFDNYIRYVLLSDGIKAESLFNAVGKLEQQVVASLAKTPEEKKLIAESEHLALVDKLLDFSLTPNEWEKYNAVIPAKAGIQSLNFTQKNVESLDSRLRGNDSLLKSFERFYSEADIRSHKMLENLLAKESVLVRGTNSLGDIGPSVLILGGFHSPQVAQLLRKEKISYVVVSPKLTKIETASGSSYLSVFARDKTPLDRLFAGEKLFIVPSGVNVAEPLTELLVQGVLDAAQTGVSGIKSWGSYQYKFIPGATSLIKFSLLIAGVAVVRTRTVGGFLSNIWLAVKPNRINENRVNPLPQAPKWFDWNGYEWIAPFFELMSMLILGDLLATKITQKLFSMGVLSMGLGLDLFYFSLCIVISVGGFWGMHIFRRDRFKVLFDRDVLLIAFLYGLFLARPLLLCGLALSPLFPGYGFLEILLQPGHDSTSLLASALVLFKARKDVPFINLLFLRVKNLNTPIKILKMEPTKVKSSSFPGLVNPYAIEPALERGPVEEWIPVSRSDIPALLKENGEFEKYRGNVNSVPRTTPGYERLMDVFAHRSQLSEAQINFLILYGRYFHLWNEDDIRRSQPGLFWHSPSAYWQILAVLPIESEVFHDPVVRAYKQVIEQLKGELVALKKGSRIKLGQYFWKGFPSHMVYSILRYSRGFEMKGFPTTIYKKIDNVLIDDLMDPTLDNVSAFLDGVNSPPSPKSPNSNPINLLNSSLATLFASMASGLVMTVVGFSGLDAGTTKTILVASLFLPGFFALLMLLGPIAFWSGRKFSGGAGQTGPPDRASTIRLWGVNASAKAGTTFIEYNDNDIAKKFDVNPALFNLLTHNSPLIRFTTHFILNLFLVPLHEVLHALGFTSEFQAFGAQGLVVSALIGLFVALPFSVAVVVVPAILILGAGVPAFIATFRGFSSNTWFAIKSTKVIEQTLLIGLAVNLLKYMLSLNSSLDSPLNWGVVLVLAIIFWLAHEIIQALNQKQKTKQEFWAGTAQYVLGGFIFSGLFMFFSLGNATTLNLILHAVWNVLWWFKRLPTWAVPMSTSGGKDRGDPFKGILIPDPISFDRFVEKNREKFIAAAAKQERPSSNPGLAVHLKSHVAQLVRLVGKGTINKAMELYSFLFIECHDLGYLIDFKDPDFESKYKEKLLNVWRMTAHISGVTDAEKIEKLANDAYDLILKNKDNYMVSRILGHGSLSIVLAMERMEAVGFSDNEQLGLALMFATHHPGFPITMVNKKFLSGSVPKELWPVLLLTTSDDESKPDETNVPAADKLRCLLADKASLLLGIPKVEGRILAAFGYGLDRITPSRRMRELTLSDNFNMDEDGILVGTSDFSGGETSKKYVLKVGDQKDWANLRIENIFGQTEQVVSGEADAFNETAMNSQSGLSSEEILMLQGIQTLLSEASEYEIRETKKIHKSAVLTLKKLTKFGVTGHLGDLDSDIRMLLVIRGRISERAKGGLSTAEAEDVDYLLGTLLDIKKNPGAVLHIKKLRANEAETKQPFLAEIQEKRPSHYGVYQALGYQLAQGALAALGQVDLLQALLDHLRLNPQTKIETLEVGPGDPLIYSNEVVNDAFILLEGEAVVTLNGSIRTLRPGEFISGRALKGQGVIVSGLDPAKFIKLSEKLLDAQLLKDPAFHAGYLKVFGRESTQVSPPILGDGLEEYDMASMPGGDLMFSALVSLRSQRDDEEADNKYAELVKRILDENKKPDQVGLIDALSEYDSDHPGEEIFKKGGRVIPAGKIIITKDELATDVFIVLEGELEGVGARKFQMGAGEIVGEMALTNGGKRTVTVRASAGSDVVVIQINGEVFRRLLKDPKVFAAYKKLVDARMKKTQQQFEDALLERENNLSKKHEGKIQASIFRDTKTLRESSDLLKDLESCLKRSSSESIERLEEEDDIFTSMRETRTEPMEKAVSALLKLFNQITSLDKFKDDSKKRQAAILINNLYQFLLLQDQADLILPFVSHALQHSLNVQNGVQDFLDIEDEEKLADCYGPETGVLMLMAAWFHDIGYGTLLEGIEEAKQVAGEYNLSGYKPGKGYHTRLGVVLAKTPLNGSGETLLSQLDQLFDLSGKKSLAPQSNNRNALDDFEYMILAHGADKKEVEKDGLKGTGKHTYSLASDIIDPLNFVVRLSDNGDSTMDERLYPFQKNPLFLAFLKRLAENKIPPVRVRQEFLKNKDVYIRTSSLYYRALQPEMSKEAARRRAEKDFNLIEKNIEAFTEYDFPHFAGMMRRRRFDIHNGHLRVLVTLNRENKLLKKEDLEFQMARMKEAYKSLQYNNKDILVEEDPEAEQENSEATLSLTEIEGAILGSMRNLISSGVDDGHYQIGVLGSLLNFLRNRRRGAERPAMEIKTIQRDLNNPLIKKGDKDETIFVLLKGEVEVLDENGKVFRTLKAGEIFGEKALLFGGKRTVSVRIKGDSITALKIEGSFVKRELFRDPLFLVSLSEITGERDHSIPDSGVFKRRVVEGPGALQLRKLLEGLPEGSSRYQVELLEAFIKHNQAHPEKDFLTQGLKELNADTVLMTKGDPASFKIFILLSGNLDGTNGNKFTIKPGELVGYMELEDQGNWKATVQVPSGTTARVIEVEGNELVEFLKDKANLQSLQNLLKTAVTAGKSEAESPVSSVKPSSWKVFSFALPALFLAYAQGEMPGNIFQNTDVLGLGSLGSWIAAWLLGLFGGWGVLMSMSFQIGRSESFDQLNQRVIEELNNTLKEIRENPSNASMKTMSESEAEENEFEYRGQNREEFSRHAIRRFDGMVRNQWGVTLSENSTDPEKILLAIHLFRKLPSSILLKIRANPFELNLESSSNKSFLTKSSRTLSIPMSSTRRDFVEFFFQGVGEVVMQSFLDRNRNLRTSLVKACENDNWYWLPATKLPASNRRYKNLQTVSEAFPQVFMHYILHGDLMKIGFDTFSKYPQKWQEVNEAFKKDVFDGGSYVVGLPKPQLDGTFMVRVTNWTEDLERHFSIKEKELVIVSNSLFSKDSVSIPVQDLFSLIPSGAVVAWTDGRDRQEIKFRTTPLYFIEDQQNQEKKVLESEKDFSDVKKALSDIKKALLDVETQVVGQREGAILLLNEARKTLGKYDRGIWPRDVSQELSQVEELQDAFLTDQERDEYQDIMGKIAPKNARNQRNSADINQVEDLTLLNKAEKLLVRRVRYYELTNEPKDSTDAQRNFLKAVKDQIFHLLNSSGFISESDSQGEYVVRIYSPSTSGEHTFRDGTYTDLKWAVSEAYDSFRTIQVSEKEVEDTLDTIAQKRLYGAGRDFSRRSLENILIDNLIAGREVLQQALLAGVGNSNLYRTYKLEIEDDLLGKFEKLRIISQLTYGSYLISGSLTTSQNRFSDGKNRSNLQMALDEAIAIYKARRNPINLTNAAWATLISLGSAAWLGRNYVSSDVLTQVGGLVAVMAGTLAFVILFVVLNRLLLQSRKVFGRDESSRAPPSLNIFGFKFSPNNTTHLIESRKTSNTTAKEFDVNPALFKILNSTPLLILFSSLWIFSVSASIFFQMPALVSIPLVMIALGIILHELVHAFGILQNDSTPIQNEVVAYTLGQGVPTVLLFSLLQGHFWVAGIILGVVMVVVGVSLVRRGKREDLIPSASVEAGTGLKNIIANKKKVFEGRLAAAKEEGNQVWIVEYERVLAQMDSIWEFSEEIRLNHPQFSQRALMEFIKPLLENDSEHINMILSSSAGLRIRTLVETLTKYKGDAFWGSNNTVERELTRVIEAKTRWAEAKGYYYLSGLPIILEDHNLSEKRKKRFKDAGEILAQTFLSTQNQFLPVQLRNIRSISIPDESSSNSSGHAGISGHIVVDPRGLSDLQIASVIQHEGSHVSRSNLIDPDHVQHHLENAGSLSTPIYEWIDRYDEPRRWLVLDELQAYADGIDLPFEYWNKNGFRLAIDPAQLLDIFRNILVAEKAISLLKEDEGRLGENGKQWLNYLVRKWVELAKQSLALSHEIRERGDYELTKSKFPITFNEFEEGIIKTNETLVKLQSYDQNQPKNKFRGGSSSLGYLLAYLYLVRGRGLSVVEMKNWRSLLGIVGLASVGLEYYGLTHLLPLFDMAAPGTSGLWINFIVGLGVTIFLVLHIGLRWANPNINRGPPSRLIFGSISDVAVLSAYVFSLTFFPSFILFAGLIHAVIDLVWMGLDFSALNLSKSKRMDSALFKGGFFKNTPVETPQSSKNEIGEDEIFANTPGYWPDFRGWRYPPYFRHSPDFTQGWKFHVSLTEEDAGAVLQAILPILKDLQISHKVINGMDEMNSLNKRGGTQAGKGIAIYFTQEDSQRLGKVLGLNRIAAKAKRDLYEVAAIYLGLKMNEALNKAHIGEAKGLTWDAEGKGGDKRFVAAGQPSSGRIGYRYGRFDGRGDGGVHIRLPNEKIIKDVRDYYKHPEILGTLGNIASLINDLENLEGNIKLSESLLSVRIRPSKKMKEVAPLKADQIRMLPDIYSELRASQSALDKSNIYLTIEKMAALGKLLQKFKSIQEHPLASMLTTEFNETYSSLADVIRVKERARRLRGYIGDLRIPKKDGTAEEIKASAIKVTHVAKLISAVLKGKLVSENEVNEAVARRIKLGGKDLFFDVELEIFLRTNIKKIFSAIPADREDYKKVFALLMFRFFPWSGKAISAGDLEAWLQKFKKSNNPADLRLISQLILAVVSEGKFKINQGAMIDEITSRMQQSEIFYSDELWSFISIVRSTPERLFAELPADGKNYQAIVASLINKIGADQNDPAENIDSKKTGAMIPGLYSLLRNMGTSKDDSQVSVMILETLIAMLLQAALSLVLVSHKFQGLDWLLWYSMGSALFVFPYFVLHWLLRGDSILNIDIQGMEEAWRLGRYEEYLKNSTELPPKVSYIKVTLVSFIHVSLPLVVLALCLGLYGFWPGIETLTLFISAFLAVTSLVLAVFFHGVINNLDIVEVIPKWKKNVNYFLNSILAWMGQVTPEGRSDQRAFIVDEIIRHPYRFSALNPFDQFVDNVYAWQVNPWARKAAQRDINFLRKLIRNRGDRSDADFQKEVLTHFGLLTFEYGIPSPEFKEFIRAIEMDLWDFKKIWDDASFGLKIGADINNNAQWIAYYNELRTRAFNIQEKDRNNKGVVLRIAKGLMMRDQEALGKSEFKEYILGSDLVNSVKEENLLERIHQVVKVARILESNVSPEGLRLQSLMSEKIQVQNGFSPAFRIFFEGAVEKISSEIRRPLQVLSILLDEMGVPLGSHERVIAMGRLVMEELEALNKEKGLSQTPIQASNLDWAYAVLGLGRGSSFDKVEETFIRFALIFDPSSKVEIQNKEEKLLRTLQAYEAIEKAQTPPTSPDAGGFLYGIWKMFYTNEMSWVTNKLDDWGVLHKEEMSWGEYKLGAWNLEGRIVLSITVFLAGVFWVVLVINSFLVGGDFLVLSAAIGALILSTLASWNLFWVAHVVDWINYHKYPHENTGPPVNLKNIPASMVIAFVGMVPSLLPFIGWNISTTSMQLVWLGIYIAGWFFSFWFHGRLNRSLSKDELRKEKFFDLLRGNRKMVDKYIHNEITDPSFLPTLTDDEFDSMVMFVVNFKPIYGFKDDRLYGFKVDRNILGSPAVSKRINSMHNLRLYVIQRLLLLRDELRALAVAGANDSYIRLLRHFSPKIAAELMELLKEFNEAFKIERTDREAALRRWSIFYNKFLENHIVFISPVSVEATVGKALREPFEAMRNGITGVPVAEFKFDFNESSLDNPPSIESTPETLEDVQPPIKTSSRSPNPYEPDASLQSTSAHSWKKIAISGAALLLVVAVFFFTIDWTALDFSLFSKWVESLLPFLKNPFGFVTLFSKGNGQFGFASAMLLVGSVFVAPTGEKPLDDSNSDAKKMGQWMATFVKNVRGGKSAGVINQLMERNPIQVSALRGESGQEINSDMLLAQLAEMVKTPAFQNSFVSELGGVALEKDDISVLIAILAASGEKPETIQLLTKLMTKKTCVIVYDSSVTEPQLRAAIAVAKQFNRGVLFAVAEGVVVPENLLPLMKTSPVKYLPTQENGQAKFDVSAFATDNGRKLEDLALLHSEALALTDGSKNVLSIFLEQLVPLSKVLNPDNIRKIQRALEEAA